MDNLMVGSEQPDFAGNFGLVEPSAFDNGSIGAEASEFVLIEEAEPTIAEMLAARTPQRRRNQANRFSDRLKSSSKRR